MKANFLNNNVGNRLTVSQNEIIHAFKILNIIRTASPFSRVQIRTEESGQKLRLSMGWEKYHING